MKTNIVNKFLLADDCALNVTTKANVQNSVEKFSKTDVMYQPASGKPYVASHITIKGQRLKVVEKFTCLAAPSLSVPSWMTRWTLYTQKRVQPLADSIVMCGIVEASRRQLKSMDNELSFLPHPLCLWNVDNLSTDYKEAKLLSRDLSKEDSRHQMAKTHTQYRSFNLGFSSQYLPHINAITATSGRSCCPHGKSLPPEETALRKAVSGKALPRRPEKVLLRHTEGLHEIYLYRP